MSRPVVVAVAVLLAALLTAPSVAAQGLAPPTPPQDVHVDTTANGVEVSWSAPISDGGSPILYYNVYHGSALIAQVTSTIYLDQSAGSAAAASSTYFVTAVNAVGESLAASHWASCVNIAVFPPVVNPVDCAWAAVDLVIWIIEHTP